ncbi:hypothetical protein RRG08_058152 [Elysia crispata]|uniref:C-type lectin domain-containing protein n=1 Tax=Elysia crispata TaxID=231223 RepID=A0AAE0Y2Q8_9GAST|nr:hypothetical protein RRG08_058152 [Elysia crispata]
MSSARCCLLSLLALFAAVQLAEGAIGHRYDLFPHPYRKRACRPEWVPHKNRCYQIQSSQRLRHYEAQRACQEQSSQSQLVTLTDDSRDFLYSQIQEAPNKSLWVAGKDGSCATLDEDVIRKKSSNCSEEKGYICQELTLFAGCPDGQIGFGNFCFSQQTLEQTWRLARLFCRTVGLDGDLATIHSKEEHDFLRREFGEGPHDQLWIGLHKENPDTPYRWANGEKVQYLPWTPDYMGQESSGYVTMSLTDNTFSAQNSSSLLIPFLCATVRVVDAGFDIKDTFQEAAELVKQEVKDAKEAVKDATKAVKDATKEALIDAPRAIIDATLDAAKDVKDELVDAALDVQELLTPCERGWLPFGQYCYKAFLERKSFNGASASCNEKGGHLPSFHNPFQSEFVRTQVIKESPMKAFWIGLSSGEKGLQWSDGSPLVYSNWESGEPNMLKSPFFDGCFQINGVRVKWTPLNCELLLFYVCEKPQESEVRSAARSHRQEQTTDSVASGSESAGDMNVLMSPAGFQPLESEDDDDELILAMKSDPSSSNSKSSSGTATILGVLVGVAVVAVVAFGVVAWRRRCRNQPYTWTPSRPKRRRGASLKGGVALEEVAPVTDPQTVIYGTMA